MLLTMFNALARCHFALARCYLQGASALSLRANAMLLTMYNALALSLTRRNAFENGPIRTPYLPVRNLVPISILC